MDKQIGWETDVCNAKIQFYFNLCKYLKVAKENLHNSAG